MKTYFDCIPCFLRHAIDVARHVSDDETLSEVEKDIFFILKIKCPVIAVDIGCELWSMVLKRSRD